MKIRFSGALIRFVDHRREIEIDAANVGEALEKLLVEYPALRPVLYDGRGQVRRAHRIFIGGDQLDVIDLTRELKPDDCIDVLTAIAGG